MKVTIGVPVYNSGQFIHKALDSFSEQTMEKSEFEVVFVDDCSTDNSLEVINSYKSKINIRTLSLEKNSGGPGAPRNKAIEIAEGEYIFFVDSDDYISKNALKEMYAFAKKNDSDVLLARMKGVNGRGVPESMFKKTEGNVDLYASRLAYALGPTKMFKTAFLRENKINFPENLKTAEDQLFTMETYVKAKVISVLAKDHYYFATFREGEHMNSAYIDPQDFYAVMSGILKVILASDEPNERKYKLAADFLNRHFYFSRTTNFSIKSMSDEKKKDWMKHLHQFVLNYIPAEVDELVNPDVKPRLVLARANDLINYQNFEKDNKARNFPVSIRDGRVIASFDALKEYPTLESLDVTFLNKLEHRLTNVELLSESLLLSCMVKHTLLTEEMNNRQQVHAVFVHKKTKEEKRYTPLLIQLNNWQYTFQIPFSSLMLTEEEVGSWDFFILSAIDSYSLKGRVGNKREPYNYKPETSFIGNTPKFHFRLTPYFTKPLDNFSIYTRKLDAFENEVVYSYERTKKSLIFTYENRQLIFPQHSMIEFENDNQYYIKNFHSKWKNGGTEIYVDVPTINVGKIFNNIKLSKIKINGLTLNVKTE